MRLTGVKLLSWCVCLLITASGVAGAADKLAPGTGPRHAIAMHGEPRYSAGFRRFDYIDPSAMKGGELVVGALGTFDSLNPFILQGNSPQAQYDISYLLVQVHTFESLMMRGHDEPFSLYGLIANSVETPEDRSWVEFELRAEARFSDGTSITTDDVIFSWQTLKDQGRPNMRRYYSLVDRIEQPAPGKVRFVFKDTGNRELPLIMGLMPILSKAFFEPRQFDRSSLDVPLGSGPYVISQVEPGRRITFSHNPNYWGNGLAVNRGRHNFDDIRYDFFRDSATLFEAFKRGDVLLRYERSAKNWATGYDFSATKDGRVQRKEFAHGRPSDMYGFVFNTRREMFEDERVRSALIHLFDFEWMNQNLFYGSFKRVESFFDNSDLGTSGTLVNALEEKLLKPYPESVKADVMAQGWKAPAGGSAGAVRANKRRALQLLSDAGWVVHDGQMVNQKTGEPFTFEILLQRAVEERIALTFAKTLEGVGIKVDVRPVDNAQFHERQETYDFDMVPFSWRGTLSPGNEQAFRYGSKEANIDGTFNLAGVKSDAVDAMIAALTDARTRDDLVAAARALDRVLLSGHYIIPFYYLPADRVAYWFELQPPDRVPLTGTKIDTWWMLPDN